MKRIIIIFFILIPFAQSLGECPNNNNVIKRKQHLHINKNLKPKFNNVKIKPKEHINISKQLPPQFNNQAKPKVHAQTNPTLHPSNSPGVQPSPKAMADTVANSYGGQAKINPKDNQKTILKATNSVAYGSTDQGLLSSTNSSGVTIVVGTSNANATGTESTGNAQNFCVASYNSSGQLNTSFGTKGVTTTDFLSVITGGATTGSIDIPKAFSVLSNGKIIVAGSTNALAGITAADYTQGNFALAQYMPNGTLDKSFGTGGTVITDIAQTLSTSSGVGSTDIIVTMQQTNGNIIVAGNTNFQNFGLVNSSFAVASYNSSGKPNTSFGAKGITVINFALTLNPNSLFASIDILTGMTILSNGKIMIYGYSNALDPNFDFAVARLNSNGKLDTSFNGNGIALTNISTVLGS